MFCSFLYCAHAFLRKMPFLICQVSGLELCELIRVDSSPSPSGVSAVEAEWIPELLPQYCHSGAPLDSPPPWFSQSSGTIRCHRASTFCRFPHGRASCPCLCPTRRLCSLWCGRCASPLRPCRLAAAGGGEGISRRPRAVQTVLQVSA